MKVNVEKIRSERREQIQRQAQDAYKLITENLPPVLRLFREGSPETEFSEIAKRTIADVQGKIAELLKSNLGLVRETAWFAVLQVCFSYSVKSWFELGDLFQQMVAEELLEETKKDVSGVLKVNGKMFVVPKRSCFGVRKTEQVVRIFNNLVSRIRSGIEQERKAERLRRRNEITLDDLVIKGCSGYCCVEIPEVVSESGNVTVLGGTFLVEGDGEGKIFAYDAAGSIEKAVNEIAEVGVFVIVSSLIYDYPLSAKKLGEKLGPERAEHVRHLWYLLKRAMNASGIRLVREEQLSVA